MKKIYAAFLTVLMFVVLSACSPQNVLRLETDYEDKKVYRGMEYLISEGVNSTVVLAFYRHLDERLIFDLEVVNNSEATLRADAADFKYKAYSHKYTYDSASKKRVWKKEFITEISALDPERTLLNIDKTASRTEARERTNTILSGISAGLGAVTDIAAAGHESSTQQLERDQRRTRESLERAERRDQFYQNISTLNQQRHYWETEALRKTDLTPGEATAGEINFPIVPDAGILQILIEIAGDVHEFEYRQRQFTP